MWADLGNVTDDEWRQIAAVHEIGFHTAGHAAVTEVTPRTVQREVVQPMVRVEAIAGYRPRIGAWKEQVAIRSLTGRRPDRPGVRDAVPGLELVDRAGAARFRRER